MQLKIALQNQIGPQWLSDSFLICLKGQIALIFDQENLTHIYINRFSHDDFYDIARSIQNQLFANSITFKSALPCNIDSEHLENGVNVKKTIETMVKKRLFYYFILIK